MLSASRTCAFFLCAISFAGLGAAAYADTISVVLSGTSSGSLAGQSFSPQVVTFTGQTTSAEVAACAAETDPNCTYVKNAYEREYFIPYSGGTVSIGGMGTYIVTGPELINFLVGVSDPEQIRLGVPGADGGLTFGASMPRVSPNYNFDTSLSWTGGPEGSFVDSECFSGPPSQCQFFAATSGGELRLTTLFQGVNGQITVTPDASAVAPEPAAWVMVATGLLAGGSSVTRRRLWP